jgi:hypothetical protein
MERMVRLMAVAAVLPLLQGWTLREGHPRIYFTPDDEPVIEARIAGSHLDQWDALYGYAERRLADAPADIAVDTWGMIGVTSSLAFVCHFSGEARFCDHAAAILEAMAAADPTGGGDDTPPRNRMEAMGIGFDWIYDYLSESQRQAVIDGIRAHVDAWIDYVNDPNFVGGHSRKGNYDTLTALVAIADEAPETAAVLDRVRNNFVDGYNPAQGWIAVDGGYHMGWAYGASYTSGEPYMAWETAVTDESLAQGWQALLGWWFLYGLRGDGTYPREGDVFDINPNLETVLVMLWALQVGGDPTLRWLYGQWRENVMWDPNFVYDIIYHDPSLPATDPSGLPQGRCFAHAGALLARDTWDEEAVHLSFISSSFLSINHHHLDNNHLELSYRGTLLQDTGQYDAYGTEHWRNYYIRTVAHNSLVVVDPDETMTLYGDAIANDGGQIALDASTLEDIVPGGPNALDGMLRCEEGGGHAYAMGDATKAYSAEKLGLFQRQVVYLRDAGTAWQRPFVVVLDVAQVLKAGLYRATVWHLPAEPAVEGARISAASGEGAVHLFVLEPSPSRVEVVGGAGREFLVDGVNYPPEATTDQEAGEWRAEVSPENPGERDRFLTVIFPAAAAEPAPSEPAVVSSPDAAGVAVGDRVVVIVDTTGGGDTLVYTLPCPAGTATHRVFGMSPSTLYGVDLDGERRTETSTTDQGTAVFDLDCGEGGEAEVTLTFLEVLPEEEAVDEGEVSPEGETAADQPDAPADGAQDAEGDEEENGGGEGGCGCALVAR